MNSFDHVFYWESGAKIADRIIEESGWYWYFCADAIDNYGIDYGEGPFATDQEAFAAFSKWRAENPSPKLAMSELRG